MEDFDFDDVGLSTRPMSENSLKMSSDKQFSFHLHKNQKIEIVHLRGSWTSGAHQELLIKLKSGVFVRISRTNGQDTFQIGAVEDGKSTNPMPILKSEVPRKPLTCGDAFNVFGKFRKLWPRYEQSDCHGFAQFVMADLFPGVNLQLPALDSEGFM